MDPQARADAHPALKVFAVNGVKEVVSRLGEEFRRDTGEEVLFTFGTIGALQDRMASGDLPDVLIAMSAAMAKAEEQELIARNGSVEVGRTGLGVAVKEGAPRPDISTPQAFRAALLGAGSLAFTDPKTGAASGLAFVKILEQMGIADQVKAKAELVAGGPVGELVAQGRAELGVQQVTELLPVKGIALLGSLPAELQRVTVYQAGIVRRTANPQGAAKFVGFVTSSKIQQRFAAAGFGRY